jgi:hypothetical protein
MSRTRDDIVTQLRQAVHGPLGRRSLAAAIRKGLDLVLELRADSVSWEQIAQLLGEVDLTASAESIRRTVRRETERRTRPGPSPAPTTAQADPRPPVPAEGPGHGAAAAAELEPLPQATGPPAPAPTSRLPRPPGTKALFAGGALLDQMKKLKEL